MEKKVKGKKPKSHKIFSWFGKGVLIAFISLVLFIIITILLYWQTNLVAKGVEKYINTKLSEIGVVKYGAISGTLFNDIYIDSLYFELYDKVAIKTKDIRLSYDLCALWDGDIKISSIYLDSINVTLMAQQKEKFNAEHDFNLDSLLAKIQHSHFLDSLFAKMPDTELGAFEIAAGFIQIPEKNLSFKNIRILADAFFHPEEFKFNLNHFSGYWVERNFELENLVFQILGNKNQITLNKFQIKTAEGKTRFVLTADLEVKSLFTIISVEDFYLDLNSFAGFDSSLANKGYSQGNFTIIGTPQNFSISSDIKGNWAEYHLQSLNLDATYSFGNIKVDTFSIRSSPGTINFTADINPYKSAAIDLQFSDINIHNVDTAFAESDLNGKVVLNFPTGTFNVNKLAYTIKRLSGNGELFLYNSHYNGSKLDSLRFAFLAENGDYSIKQPSFIQIADQARFDLYGDLSRDKTLDLQVYSSQGDLNTLTTAIGVDSIYGSYFADFRAFGNLDDPTIIGDFRINNFVYQEIFLDSIDLELHFSNLLTTPVGITNFKIRHGVVYDIPIRDLNINAAKDASSFHITNARVFSEENYIEMTLDIFNRENTSFVQINHLRMEYENYWLQNKDSIMVQLDSINVSVKNFNLSGSNNTLLLADAFYNFDNNNSSVDLVLSGLDMEPFQQFLGDKYKISGILSGTTNFKYIDNKPDVFMDINGRDIFFSDVPLGDFTADFEYNSEKLFIRKLLLQNDLTKFSVNGDLSFQFDKKITRVLDFIKETQTNLRVEWQNIDLQKYNKVAGLKYPLKGILNGYLDIEGTINNPFMRQFLSLNKFKYNSYNVDSLVMFSQYNSGYLILDSLGGNFNGTSFNMKGYQQLDLGLNEVDTTFMDNPFDFFISSKGNYIDFIGLFNEQVDAIKGPYEFEMNIAGTPDKPFVNSGKIKMENGTILLSRIKDPVKNVDVDIFIEDNILTINNFRGESLKEQDFWQIGFSYLKKLWSWMSPKEQQKGIFIVDGTIDLENIFKPDIDVHVFLNEFFVDYFVENTKVMISSSNLAVKGKEIISATGNIFIPYGEFEVNINQIQKNMYMVKPDGEKSRIKLAANLEIEIPGNFVVTSSALDIQNNFKIVLQGNLQASISPESNNLSLIGVMETESGKFSSYNQSFNVTNGTINFNNPLRINPELNIVTQKKLQDKLFELVITGNLESIKQEIIIRNANNEELTLSPQDKIAMLTLGADLSMVTSKTDSTLRGVGEDVATNVVLTAAERGVEEITGFDRVEISTSDKFLDLQKLKLNNGLKQASISFGKYLTSDLYVEYRTQFGSGMPTPKLSWDAGNKISLQYRINKHWSFDSHYEKTTLSNNKVQLGVSWELTF